MLFHQCDLLPGEENKAAWKGGGSVSGMGWDCEIGKASWRGTQERGEREAAGKGRGAGEGADGAEWQGAPRLA